MGYYSRFEPVTLMASATKTATGNSGTGTGGNEGVVVLGQDAREVQAMVFVFNLTDAKTDAVDTLDVFVQTKLGSEAWYDIVHFTQILGNGDDTVTYVAKVTCALATAEYEIATDLGAAAVRNLLGREFRVRWAITDADGDASFTFSVVAVPM